MIPESLPHSELVQALFALARVEAERLYHDYIGTEHVLIALSRAENGATARLLQHLDLAPHVLRARLRARVQEGARRRFLGSQPGLTPRLAQALRLAHEAAGEAPIGERALLLGVLRAGPGVAARVLAATGMPIERLVAWVEADSEPEALQAPPGAEARGGFTGPLPVAPRGGGMPAASLLDRYTRDLTAKAQAGKLRPAQERQRELVQIAEALARPEPLVPVLVGEAGVGKTAIVEGFALRLAQDDEKPLKNFLKGKRVLQLDISLVVAGSSYRGEFEERLHAIIAECIAHPEVILFIDEIHTLVGAGNSSGNQDAAQILKPYISRGEIRLIGATTPAEYERYIAKDAALGRRMPAIRVEEMTPEDTKKLLHAMHADLERRYMLHIDAAALDAAVDLAVRYLPDQFLPAKAIEVLASAEAGAVVNERMSAVVGPQEIEHVTVQSVQQVIAKKLGVPVGDLSASEQERLRTLGLLLRDSVVGQDEALADVEAILQVSLAGLHTTTRPRAVLLFAGPTGVGKTEMARAIARTMFPGDLHQTLLQIDMGEFTQEHALAGLIGSPPGYVGYEREGRLTSWLKRHPFSVVLFDEIEKAHQSTLDLLLGLFDTGRMTDGQGRTVTGREAIFILTTNLLAQVTGNDSVPGMTFNMTKLPSKPLDRQRVLRQQLVKELRPELVNRFDRVVGFKTLDPMTMRLIAQRRLMQLEQQMSQMQITLLTERVALEWLVRNGFDPLSGARELDRTIAQALEPELARLKLAGELVPGATVTITVDDRDTLRATVQPAKD